MTLSVRSNDTLQKGEGGGVMRDVLSEYWESFSLERASGCDGIVPVVRPSLSRKQYVAEALKLCANSECAVSDKDMISGISAIHGAMR